MINPAVTYLTLDEAPQKLWHEWLTTYFDGAPHMIGPSGTDEVTFPTASVTFDQGDVSQPTGSGTDVNIQVLQRTVGDAQFLTATGKFRREDIRWDFFVRCSSVAPGRGNAAFQCRQAAQLLRACLMNDNAVQPLAQKGIFDLEVGEVEPVASQAYQLRRIRVSGRLEYELQTLS